MKKKNFGKEVFEVWEVFEVFEVKWVQQI